MINKNDYYELKLQRKFEYKRINAAYSDEDVKMSEEKAANRIGDQKQGNDLSDSQKSRANNALHRAIKLQSFKQDEEDIKQSPIFYPFYRPSYNLLIGSQHIYIFLR